MNELDDLDIYILKIMEKDARTSYRKIADQLNISVGTVYNRLEKLKKNEIIKPQGFLVNLNEEKLGFALKFVILVRIDGHHTEEVLNNFKKLPQITNIYHILGEMSAVLICRFREMSEVQKFVKRVMETPHVLKTTSNTVLKTYKENQHHLIEDLLAIDKEKS